MFFAKNRHFQVGRAFGVIATSFVDQKISLFWYQRQWKELINFTMLPNNYSNFKFTTTIPPPTPRKTSYKMAQNLKTMVERNLALT